MFYCEACARENRWPYEFWFMLSHGPCECCGKVKACVDVPSIKLPKPDSPAYPPEGAHVMTEAEIAEADAMSQFDPRARDLEDKIMATMRTAVHGSLESVVDDDLRLWLTAREVLVLVWPLIDKDKLEAKQ